MSRITKYISIMSVFITIFSSFPIAAYADSEGGVEELAVYAEGGSDVYDGSSADTDIIADDITDEQEISAETGDAYDDAVPADDKDQSIIAEGEQGDILNPIPLDLNKEITGTSAHNDMYFSFTVDKPGYISPYIKKAAHNGAAISIYVYYKETDDTNIVYQKKTIFDEEYKDPGKIGLRPGNFIVKLSFGSKDIQYALMMKYVQCDDYEEELDSSKERKKVAAGQYYYGGCTGGSGFDKADYYYFELDKKTKVTIEASVTSGLWDMELTLLSGTTQDTKIASKSGSDFSITKELEAGKYNIHVGAWSSGTGQLNIGYNTYKFMVSAGGKGSSKKSKKTGTASMNGVTYDSLKAAFKDMKEAKDYTVDLVTDMDGEGNLTIPKKPTSVTINGNGNKIKIIGSKLTSNTNLKLKNVAIVTVKKSGSKAKLTLNAKKDLEIGEGVSFDTLKTVIKTGKELKLTGDLNASSINAGTLNIEGGSLTVNKDNKVTVKTGFKSLSGNIILGKDFNKPITLKGSAEGLVKIKGEKQPDGTQILASKQKKIDPETLKKVFDVKEITDNENETSLFYYKKGKAGIFGESIRYKDKSYGLWKDAVAQMNADKGADSQFEVTLTGDVVAGGALTMPKKGYKSLSVNTIDGKTFKLTFTGDIKLTGDTAISDSVTLTKVNKKGSKVSGKVIKKKYKYTGKDTF